MALISRLCRKNPLTNQPFLRKYGSAAAADGYDYERWDYTYPLVALAAAQADGHMIGRGVQWVFIGSPGVEKSAYASKLAELLNVPHISMGNLVREELRLQSSLSKQELEGRVARLADHLGTSIANHVDESPNRLSEDLVHCMAAIYCKLAEPPLPNIGFSSSPTSSLSSSSTFSPRDQCESWSPSCKNDVQCDVMLIDPFCVKRAKESIGAYTSMVEVPWICVDNDRLSYAAKMLHTFKSYVQRLEKVDLKGLKHEEKLAFWINIYNALMMHAYLAYGIPRNHLKRVQLLLKAAYKVGGLSINAHIIQNILGCRLYRPAQWLQTLQTLLSAGMKFKAGDERQAYALNRSEPLVCFAVCCGGHSDPAVRVYTAKNVYQELEAAKEEYIHASVGVSKSGKVLLPKLLEGFANDSFLSLSGLLDIVCKCLPESQRNDVRKFSLSKPHKIIEWLPYNFSFRYIFSRELAKWTPPLLS